MKTIAAIAFVILAYGIAGTMDYQDSVTSAPATAATVKA
jgi:hypothetical protein